MRGLFAYCDNYVGMVVCVHVGTNVWLSGQSRLLSSEGLATVEIVGVGFEAREV